METQQNRTPPLPDGDSREQMQYMLDHAYMDVGLFLRSLANDSTTCTFWGDMQKNLYYISDSMRDSFGFPRNKVSDLPPAWSQRIYNPLDRAHYVDDIHALLSGQQDCHDMRYQVVTQSGDIVWVHSTAMLKWDEDHKTPLFLCGKVTQQDRHLLTDPISDFAGEPLLAAHLAALDKAGRGSTCIGFRLNSITKIFSVLGRARGKELIRTIACGLRRSCPARMPFYRVDSTHFVGVLSDTADVSPQEVIETMRETVTRSYRKMDVITREPCAFALMRYPCPRLTISDYLQEMAAMTDLAALEPEHPYLDETSTAVLQKQQKDRLELLLNQNVLEDMDGFRAVVQLVVSANTGQIVGGETLLRWRHNELDVSPDIFIPILERSGLILQAGRWIFEQAVIACKELLPTRPDFALSVNISPRQLLDDSLLEFIPQVLKKHGLDGSHIMVEITERGLDQEPERVLRLCEVCQSCGIRIALDDFGTGYTSMQVLLKYPLDMVKIHRDLLVEMTESKKKYNFFSSIVYACHQFGMEVCVVGVETEKERGLSWYTNCDIIQGFCYYRPTELSALLQPGQTIL